jgi:hypothetical protein
MDKNMKKNTTNILVEKISNIIVKNILERMGVSEGTGFDAIFEELKVKLGNITILPDNVIDASAYKENEIINALKSMGYQYKKPISGKLHFFNKKTSISLYLIQNGLKITLMP